MAFAIVQHAGNVGSAGCVGVALTAAASAWVGNATVPPAAAFRAAFPPGTVFRVAIDVDGAGPSVIAVNAARLAACDATLGAAGCRSDTASRLAASPWNTSFTWSWGAGAWNATAAASGALRNVQRRPRPRGSFPHRLVGEQRLGALALAGGLRAGRPGHGDGERACCENKCARFRVTERLNV